MEKQTKKALLILTRTLGDVVLGNVLVKNIKLNYTDITQLDYVVEEKYIDLIKYNPNITNVIPITNTEDAWLDILRTMTNDKYDYIFCPQQTSSTDNVWHQNPQYNKRHLLNFYAKKCGIKIIDSTLELFVNGSLNGDWPHLPKPIVALHNTSLVDVKNWDKFDELSMELNKLKFGVVQIGHKDDKQIVGAFKLDLSLSEIMMYFNEKHCNCFVGLDSGLSYIASAFKIPTVILHGATAVETSGAYGENTEIIIANQNSDCEKQRGKIRCHGILQGKCQFGDKCINSITVENVINLIKSKINKQPGDNNGQNNNQ